MAQYQIGSSAWVAISSVGQSGAVWLDEDNDGTLGAVDCRVIQSTSTPLDADFSKAKRVYKPDGNTDMCLFSAIAHDYVLYARCASGSSALVTFDNGVGSPQSRIKQQCEDGDAVLNESKLDDFIDRGLVFQIKRNISLPVGVTKFILDHTAVPTTSFIYNLPFSFYGTGGPVAIRTYRVADYTGGTLVTPTELNKVSSAIPAGFVKTGITSAGTPGADLREYLLGATGNAQQVARAGSSSGSSVAVKAAGSTLAKLCIEITNSYTEAITFNYEIIWAEVPR